MKRFKCKLPYEGSPVIYVEAYDIDGAMDAAARKYGWSGHDEMRQNHEKTGAWDKDSGFTVTLVRDGDEDGKA